MAARKVRKAIRAWWRRQQKQLSVLKYRLRLFRFARSNNAKLTIRGHFRKHSTLYLTSLYFIVAIIVSLTLQSVYYDYDNKTLFGFYTSVGAMTGGMLAIIFTFITLLVNYALTAYPPQFFKLSGYDRKQDIVYFLLAGCSISFFLIGFSYTGSAKQNFLLNFISIFLLFFVFYLIFMSYISVRKRLNPMTAFSKYIMKPAIKLLDEANRKANKVAKVFESNPLVKASNKEQLAKQQAQLLLREHYEMLNNYLSVLFEYHDMLVEKKQFGAAFRVLDGVVAIFSKYISVRKDNLILLPTQYLMVLETDSQNFFASNFERLSARVSHYIDIGNVEGIRKSIQVFNSIGQELANLEFTRINTENPPFEQCIGYLNQVRDIAIQKKNVEACFKIAEVYGYLGSAAIVKKYVHHQSYAHDSLLSLYAYSVATSQEVVATRVMWSFGMMSEYFMQREGFIYHTDYKVFMDKYKELLKYHLIAKTNGDDLKANTTEDLLKPLRVLQKHAYKLINEGSNTRNADRLQKQRELIEVIDLVRDIARSLSDYEKKTVVDRYFYLQVMKILEIFIYMLIDISQRLHWRQVQADALSKLNWAVNQFGFGLRGIDSKLTHSNLDDMGNILAKVAILSLSKQIADIPEICVKLIHTIANTYMNSGIRDRDYESPRIMINVYLLGVLALHINNAKLLKLTKTQINTFKETYRKVFFPKGYKVKKGVTYIGPRPEQIYVVIAEVTRKERLLAPGNTDFIGEESPRHYANRIFSNMSRDEFIAVKKYYKM